MKMQRGDIIFTRPKHIFFSLVRFITQGDYGHVALVVDTYKDHIFIVEALPKGVDINNFIYHKGEAYIVYRNVDLTDKQRDTLVSATLSWCGAPYDTMALLNFIIGRTWFGKSKYVYCSELIYRILIKLNLLSSTIHPEKISPAKLRKIIKVDSSYRVIDKAEAY